MRKLLGFLTICLVLAGAAGIWRVYDGYHSGQKEYQDLNAEYVKVIRTSDSTEAGDTEPEEEGASTVEEILLEDVSSIENVLPEDVPPMKIIDFQRLRKINQDMIGWIDIPSIKVSYPIMHAGDNEYYLHRDIHQEYLFAGSIFLDCSNCSDFSDPNSIIYGHNMRDGSMFAGLKNTGTPENLKACSYFWIYTEKENILYRIISVKQTSNGSSCYQLRFADDPEFENWILEMIRSSETDCNGYSEVSGIQSQVISGKVVTLSTCTENSLIKQVVQGIEVGRQ